MSEANASLDATTYDELRQIAARRGLIIAAIGVWFGGWVDDLIQRTINWKGILMTIVESRASDFSFSR